MTQFCIDYLRYHFFGRNDETYNHDLISMMVDQLNQIKNPRNLGLFIESHARRTPIKINRSTDGKPSLNSLKCGVLLITGDNSPAVDDTVDMNSKLDPTNSTWMKISSASSLVLEEQPNHVVNALILFLQGYGYGNNFIIGFFFNVLCQCQSASYSFWKLSFKFILLHAT